jgi:zinc/manganese transport system permease protein
MEATAFLAYPFLACVLLILIHTYFGIHVLERGIIFVDLSLAQFIGLGMALSFSFGHEGAETYIVSVLFAGLGAFILSFSRRIAKLTNIEAFIGVLYIFSLAASILLLDRTPHGVEEFKAILNGNILWVGWEEITSTFIVYAAVGSFHFVFRRRFLALSLRGDGGFFWEFLFFFSFALVLVKSVRIAGILQVFAFLIIPALIGRLFTTKILRVIVSGWLIGLLSSLFGIAASYKWDLPLAPLVVSAMGGLFFLMLWLKSFRDREQLISRDQM